MAAYVRHRFKKGFLLDEERIRKINEILCERLEGLDNGCELAYRVYRADAFSYTTSRVEDVIAEENTRWQRIVSLSVSATYQDALGLKLEFSDSGTELNIEGEDRDFVYLLFSDLRQYISKEVNCLRGIPKPAAMIVTLGLMIVGLAAIVTFFVQPTRRPAWRDLDTVLASQDVHEKLDYLLECRRPTAMPGALSVGMGSMLAALLVMFFAVMDIDWVSRVGRYLFPANVFLFGKELDRYERSQALRGKIVWGILIAFGVALVAGLVVWFVTGR